ncbi:hypothetical protein [Vitreimonas sp.]|uniref:hypothetical protein n=1 Tax=Vitreimonas sp. TaxID=3069702 RepID=UPI002ED9B257
MAIWTEPRQLVIFGEVLARARADGTSVSDEELITQARAAHWGTNCWSWVEMSFAIISATCALRPHLALDLVGDPIDVMIQGGLEREEDVIAQGVALARKDRPYVPLTEEGRTWLLESWPRLEKDARAIFRRKWIELTE